VRLRAPSPAEYEWKRKQDREENTEVSDACNAITQAPIKTDLLHRSTPDQHINVKFTLAI
jgi:hypothetical protein